MNRREFLRSCAVLGAGGPFFGFLAACADDVLGKYSNFEVNFTGRVTVVGAGAAGLAAAYILDRYGIDFEVLEANDRIGGRVKRTSDFADFPIDLGAEWIHTNPNILAQLIDDPTVSASIEVVPYSVQRLSNYNNGRLRQQNWGGNFYSEYKFKHTTWFGFLEEYIAAPIIDRVQLNSPVTRVDYSGDRIRLTTDSGAEFESDRVVLTVPVAVYRDGLIEFSPALPNAKTEAFEDVTIPDGMKAFFEFSERFYPDLVLNGGLLGATSADHLYYDAAFRKESSRNVLGIFSVGERTSRYATLTDEELGELLLSELDEVFDGKASRYYLNHIVQNWTAEPYIRGAYTADHRGDETAVINALKEPVDGRLYFAGEAMSLESWATVHGAMESAYAVVESLLRRA
ncbi:MAG: monoamine oxidase [Bradymonadia bacterium]|jgi:monoamine oxidase